jgi:thiol-disulfide isomerase/thioredoxin
LFEEAAMLKYRLRNLIVLTLVSTGIVLALTGCGQADDAPAESMIGEQAPELSGDDLTGTGVDDLADLSGKPTAVVFWLNTCPHCQDGLPAIQAAALDLEEKYNILTVGMANEDAEGEPGFETPEAFVESVGLTLPTVAYTWDRAKADWRISQVPTVFILDDQHRIEDVIGAEEDLVGAIETSLENVELKCCGS